MPTPSLRSNWIIGLGPDAGGEIVTAGSPKKIVREKRNYTGAFLKRCWRGGERGKKRVEAAE